MSTRKWAELAVRLWRRQKQTRNLDARLRMLRLARVFESPEARTERMVLSDLRQRDWAGDCE